MSDVDGSNVVAYLGPQGTYSHEALVKYFGAEQPVLPADNISDIFSMVDQGKSQYGLVPVENSTEGSITLSLDCLSRHHLQICAEVMLRINHCLMISQDADIKKIKTIISHQQSLGQCRNYLAEHYPEAGTRTAASNGEAAKVASENPEIAAIASKKAAEIYGLKIVSSNIEDAADNTTRFAVISKSCKEIQTGNDKTSIIIFTRNEPGALFNALEPFKIFGVNLIRLESRPTRTQAWSYAFFVDLEGHVKDKNVGKALNALRENSLEVTILGSYPAAKSA